MISHLDAPANAAEMPRIITLFGDNEPLDRALSEELGRRGSRTHTVSVATGWLSSVTHAIVRLDTAAGAVALRELTTGEHPPAHVVATCEKPEDSLTSDRLSELCRRCGDHHDVALIWHPHLPPEPPRGQRDAPARDLSTGILASTVADAVQERAVTGRAPSFAARTFEPSR
jgi:hypothetical protein